MIAARLASQHQFIRAVKTLRAYEADGAVVPKSQMTDDMYADGWKPIAGYFSSTPQSAAMANRLGNAKAAFAAAQQSGNNAAISSAKFNLNQVQADAAQFAARNGIQKYAHPDAARILQAMTDNGFAKFSLYRMARSMSNFVVPPVNLAGPGFHATFVGPLDAMSTRYGARDAGV